jgi:pyruvate kinase
MLPAHLIENLSPPLLVELTWLYNSIVKEGHEVITQLAPEGQENKPLKSINNLGQYLALRRHDLRPLQDRLAEIGLSSLGRCESHVMATLSQIITVVSAMQKRPHNNELPQDVPTFQEGKQLLEENSAVLFGQRPSHRITRIMVTLPTEAATDAAFVSALIESGMETARINCAHDSPQVWKGMIDNVRSQAKAMGRDCKIMMDLAGQKIRTGPVAQQPGVIRIRVQRNTYGAVTRPTFVELYDADRFPNGSAPFEISHRHSIPLSNELFRQLAAGDRLLVKDARGKQRQLLIHAHPNQETWLASTEQTIYLTEGSSLRLQRKVKKWQDKAQDSLPPLNTQDEVIRLYRGNPLRLTYDQLPGQDARRDEKDNILEPAHISCTQAKALEQVQIGQNVWIDDGKLGAVVSAKDSRGLVLNITHAPSHGMRLHSDKGINLPQTDLDLPCLTEKDRFDLRLVCQHADMVGLSFAQKAGDIQALMNELNMRNAKHIGIVAKIETRQGIKNLPQMIVQALGQYPLGIMIARGDLAVELGGERMAEMQEEMLWLCESAHVPVIWATQVLETLAKSGISTRPELTDAAMSERAECVMLNKGPHILQALKTLDDILSRMESHQYKKGARLRDLHQWD